MPEYDSLKTVLTSLTKNLVKMGNELTEVNEVD